MIGLDTNVLVRFFTNDDRAQAAKARHFIGASLSTESRGHISLVTLAELVWVLSTRYGFGAEGISDALATLLADERFAVQDRTAAWTALDLYRMGQVDFADALIAAVDRWHGASTTVTFDKLAARRAGMTMLE